MIQQVLPKYQGVRNISDDIIVFGKPEMNTTRTSRWSSNDCNNRIIPINQGKCLFGVSNLTFFGYELSASGISPGTKKVETIRDAPVPVNAAEVRSSDLIPTARVLSQILPWLPNLCASLLVKVLPGDGILLTRKLPKL